MNRDLLSLPKHVQASLLASGIGNNAYFVLSLDALFLIVFTSTSGQPDPFMDLIQVNYTS
jgi:hypothetical protein